MSRTVVLSLILVCGMAVREATAQQQEDEGRRAKAALRLQFEQMRMDDQRAAQAVIVRPIWTDDQFDRWIFPQHDRAGARQWFDAQLAVQIDRIDRAYRLTETQKNKLRLAGQGDIKRFFDRYESAKERFHLVGQDIQKLRTLMRATLPLQAAAQYLFREDSLLFKSLPNTLTAEQLARYEVRAREQRAFAHVRLLHGEGSRGWVTRLAVSPDGRQLVTTGGDAVRLWDLKSGKAIRVFGQHPGDYWCVAFSADGRRIATGSNDHTARVWDTATAKEVQKFTGHTDEVWGVAFSADGRQLVTAGWDQSIRVWDVETGKQLRLFEGVHDKIRCLAVSPDGKLIAAGHFADDNHPGILRLWDLAQGKEIRTFRGHTREITSVVFSSDGRSLLTSGYDHTVRLWDVDSGKEIRCLEGHTNRVQGAAFSPDGRYIASCGDQHDATVRIWDAHRGQELLCSERCGSGFLAIAMLPEAGYVVTTGADGMVRLWPWKK